MEASELTEPTVDGALGVKAACHRSYLILDAELATATCALTTGNPSRRYWARRCSSGAGGSPSTASRHDGKRRSVSGAGCYPCAPCYCCPSE